MKEGKKGRVKGAEGEERERQGRKIMEGSEDR